MTSGECVPDDDWFAPMAVPDEQGLQVSCDPIDVAPPEENSCAADPEATAKLMSMYADPPTQRPTNLPPEQHPTVAATSAPSLLPLEGEPKSLAPSPFMIKEGEACIIREAEAAGDQMARDWSTRRDASNHEHEQAEKFRECMTTWSDRADEACYEENGLMPNGETTPNMATCEDGWRYGTTEHDSTTIVEHSKSIDDKIKASDGVNVHGIGMSAERQSEDLKKRSEFDVDIRRTLPVRGYQAICSDELEN
jgi:hypothetical protein